MSYRLRYEIDWVRVIEQDCTGANPLHVRHDIFHHVDRAQRHEEAAGPLRLLPDDPVLERYALVKIARLEPTGAETGQHRIAILQAGRAVRGGRDRQIEPRIARHLLRERLYQG